MVISTLRDMVEQQSDFATTLVFLTLSEIQYSIIKKSATPCCNRTLSALLSLYPAFERLPVSETTIVETILSTVVGITKRHEWQQKVSAYSSTVCIPKMS
jgi:hypothetical protein